ncbi:MAG: hypothetical protein WDO68_32430 [Gammaproteobacteria bacterium]
MKFVIRITALLALLALAACGGGSDNPAPAGGGDAPPAPTATAPTITTQPLAQNVTVPEPATFSVIASGTGPLAYQWRYSTDGTSWTNIASATGASYATGATEVGMNSRYYSVIVSNSAGSVASSSAQLTATGATPPSSGDGGDGGGSGGGSGGSPSGEFPHTPNPLAVAVTPGAGTLSSFDVSSAADSTVQSPNGASDIVVANGVTVSFGFPGNAFLEDQSLAATQVSLASLDSNHPLPFESVIAAFDLDPTDNTVPEIQTNNLVRVTFTLTQQTLDALSGQLVIFSARSDGTQLHLVPVFANADGTWSALTLTTNVGHLGIFGIATVSGEQAAVLGAAWPSYVDLQLETAIAPASYGLRKTLLSGPAVPAAFGWRPMAVRINAADSPSDADWAAQMQARVDAYYNDVVAPALNAAGAADADIAQFREASQALSTWERMRQLLGLQDERDATVSQQLIDLTKRGLEKAMEDCSTNKNAAATVQALGILRQIALLGGETDTTLQSVMDTCGRSTYDISVGWTQVHNLDDTVKPDTDAAHAFTAREQLNATASGKLHLSGSTPELTSATLDSSFAYDRICDSGAFSCTPEKRSVIAHDTNALVAQCGSHGFFGSYRVDRWNLDARGHVAGPSLYVTFQNAFGCLGNSFNVASNQATQTNYDNNGSVSSTTTTSASEAVDTAPWSGAAKLGSSSRIVRRSSEVTTPNVQPGAFERWTTSLTFTITEVPSD